MSAINDLKQSAKEEEREAKFEISPVVRRNYKEILGKMLCSPNITTLRDELPALVFVRPISLFIA